MHNSTASAGAGAITACTAQARDQAQALWRHVKSAGARASEITQPQQKPSVPKPEEHKGQEQSASANASASAGTTLKNLPCSNFNCSLLSFHYALCLGRPTTLLRFGAMRDGN